MIFNTIANGSSHKKGMPFNQRTNALNNKFQNIQRHVTFRDSNRNKQQVINPTSKPKYNFTYGQPVNHFTQQQILSQSFYRNVSPHFQTFQIQPKQSLAQSSFVGNDKNRSESTRKRLKIFPQKYNQKKQKTQTVLAEVKKEQPKDEVKNQVNLLKNQIQKLKAQIRNLSQNISKNTSRDFTQTQINKNEAQRTRRLSELNQFNQKLYNQLALKLKQISLAEYQNYLDQTNSNKKILDQIFQSASKSKLYENSNQNKLNVNQNFMDIREFEHQYQQKYNSTGGTENPIQNFDFVPHILPHNDSVGSPFLVNQNQFIKTNNQQKYVKTELSLKKKLQKDQVFTFNKQRMAHQRHFQKPLYLGENQLFTLQADNRNNQNEKKTEKHRNQGQKRFQIGEIKKIKDGQNPNKSQKQLQDFNRELQNKILKKRVNSQYTTINKHKKY